MLCLTHASLATFEQLFHFKNVGFELEDFPGYTTDQWGIKAHNRPWIEAVGGFSDSQRIIEVGGAYSLLPKYLSDKFNLEAWIGDDFGLSSGASNWSRWGDPRELPKKYPAVKYVFQPFGINSSEYPDQYFDRIFTVSTLEHIPRKLRLNVFRDMNRCLKPAGKQLHTIDIGTKWGRIISSSIVDKVPLIRNLRWKIQSEIRAWINLIKASGVEISAAIPDPIRLLDRRTLVESPDVVYRFYPPNNAPKAYNPSASLLLVIEDI